MVIEFVTMPVSPAPVMFSVRAPALPVMFTLNVATPFVVLTVSAVPPALWVRTTSPVGNGGPIYIVISTKGEVIDRVQLPEGRLIAGFGKSGDVYLALRNAEGNARVERAKIR